MDRAFKRFDRVRVRRANRGYEVGDKGTILEGPSNSAGPGTRSYVVGMDKDAPGSTTVIFSVEDIELDQ
jgi:hypothetical protein